MKYRIKNKLLNKSLKYTYPIQVRLKTPLNPILIGSKKLKFNNYAIRSGLNKKIKKCKILNKRMYKKGKKSFKERALTKRKLLNKLYSNYETKTKTKNKIKTKNISFFTKLLNKIQYTNMYGVGLKKFNRKKLRLKNFSSNKRTKKLKKIRFFKYLYFIYKEE